MDIERHEFFYHYTSRSTFFEKILPQGQLRLSPYSLLRDPLEFRVWFESEPAKEGEKVFTYPMPGTPEYLEQVHSGEAAEAAQWEEAQMSLGFAQGDLDERTKVLSLTVDVQDDAIYQGDADVFGRAWSRARLWEQYGDNHQGVCIVLKREKLADAIHHHCNEVGGVVFSGIVHYTPTGPVGSGANFISRSAFFQQKPQELLDSHIEKMKDPLFFSKTLDWASEYEYRFVIRSATSGPEYIPIDQCAVAGVIFGHRVSHSAIGACVAQLEGTEIWTACLIWDRLKPPKLQPVASTAMGRR